jgi:hypothetical protein
MLPADDGRGAHDGETMPPADYTFFNHAARLDDGERADVIRWASGTR